MDKIIKQFIKEMINNKIGDPDSLSQLKRNFAKKHGLTPTNIILLKAYYSMLKSGEIAPSQKQKNATENLLRVRKVRSQSGVAVVAVLTKDFGCPGHCLYCPTEKGMPKSYLSNEPAVMRAISNDFDPYRQVKMRLEALENSGHPTDKIELIIIGGTFSAIPDKYRYEFIKRCYQAANDFKSSTYKKRANLFEITTGGQGGPHCNRKQLASFAISKLSDNKSGLKKIIKNLNSVKKINEKARHRLVGITIETRPDYINKKEILKLRELGVTRVEMGAQSIYDDILSLNKRGHNISQTISATRLLKDAGFKINYHMMPNLPGSSVSRDKKMFKELFSNENFQPDILKIYPTVVVKNSELYQWWKRGKYKPYSDKKLFNLLIDIKKGIPPHVRIMRLIRDIPAQSIVAGSKISNLRQIIEQKTRQNILRCRCIRCREIKDKKFAPKNLELKRTDYPASGGKEIFLSFENVKKDKLFALLRLRIPSQIFTNEKLSFSADRRIRKGMHFIPALQNSAIIREVHTYGQLVPIAPPTGGRKKRAAVQHIGLGKQLIAEAERIARGEFNIKKIAVISGVGVRDYYRKLGYELKDEYMIKKLR
jgi:elongator complex protein 3